MKEIQKGTTKVFLGRQRLPNRFSFRSKNHVCIKYPAGLISDGESWSTTFIVLSLNIKEVWERPDESPNMDRNTDSRFYYKWVHLWGRQFKRGVCHEYNPAPQHSYWPSLQSRLGAGTLLVEHTCCEKWLMSSQHEIHRFPEVQPSETLSFSWALPANSLQLHSFIMTSFPEYTSSHSIFYNACKRNAKYLLSSTAAELFICKMRSLRDLRCNIIKYYNGFAMELRLFPHLQCFCLHRAQIRMLF